MSKFAVLGTCLSLVAGATVADPITVSGSGSFSAFPGYGYQYTATWEASAGDFSFVPSFSSVRNISPPGARIQAEGSFISATGSIYEETFDFHATVVIRFVDTATGQLAFPPALSTNAFTTGNIIERYSPILAIGGIRFSDSLETTTMTLQNANGANLANGLSPVNPPPSVPANTEVRFVLNEHFEAGNVLLSSPDPNCASFACMIPSHDSLGVGPAEYLFRLNSGSLVPEPSVATLMFSGLLGITFMARRRR